MTDAPQNQTDHSRPPSVQAESKPAHSSSSTGAGWGVGLALIIIGGLFLARNLGVDLFFLHFHNWWAIFILVASLVPLMGALRNLKAGGPTSVTYYGLLNAAMIAFVAIIFLIDLSFFTWWPVFIIFAGFYAIVGRLNK
jgi:hypothetical protein